MKQIPTDPMALQARAIAALCADIGDRQAKGFPRVDALRSINQVFDAIEGKRV